MTDGWTSCDIFDWFDYDMSDYRDILRAEGHDVEGEVCTKCWDEAVSKARWRGGKVLDWYREIVQQAKTEAMRRAS